MRVHYHGSRALGSLSAFYSDVTGAEPLSLDSISHDKIGQASNREKHDNVELKSCPFFWARSPWNLLRQQTYLLLATAFVVLRMLYLVSPKILLFAQFVWRRCIQFERLGSLLELLLTYQKFRIKQNNCCIMQRSQAREGIFRAEQCMLGYGHLTHLQQSRSGMQAPVGLDR